MAPPPASDNYDDYTTFSRVGSVDSVFEFNINNNGKKYSGQINDNQYNRSNNIDSEDNMVKHFTSILDLSASMHRPDRDRANTYTFRSNQTVANDSSTFQF